MADVAVVAVSGTEAVPATPISLAEARLEKQHLQEWVLQHPQILGGDVKIVSFEFGNWTGSGGGSSHDRLDVLGLDVEGRLVVVELKRDKAPDTVDMQALKYSALVSRFTREDVDKVHTQFLTRKRGEQVSVETAAAELDEWATINEDNLRVPRMMLMASSFPRPITATIVFLHQQLGLDVQLLAFQAYRTDDRVLLTVSQHYPPPDIEEFVLSPEVVEAKQQRTAKSSKKREATTVSRLIGAKVIEDGAPLTFRSPFQNITPQVDAWIAADPLRGRATWQNEVTKPLIWEADGDGYTPTGLTSRILKEAADYSSAVQGPVCWLDDNGLTLVELADTIPAGSEVPVEVHLRQAHRRDATDLRCARHQRLLGLGTDVTRSLWPRASATSRTRSSPTCASAMTT